MLKNMKTSFDFNQLILHTYMMILYFVFAIIELIILFLVCLSSKISTNIQTTGLAPSKLIDFKV